ncbi:UDP-N-acetylmuramoyl-tripeptide--D-alanyl-D-alanine ligase [compost metagenome]
MYQFLSENNKYVFVNLDDTIQREKTEKNLRITFSHTDKNASVLINKITANPFVAVEFDGIKVKSHLIGLYNANNINAAITIGRYFKISDDEIKEAIESYIPENNRSQMLVKNSNEIILDAYNANPSSMEVAIKNFLQLDKPNKVAILGDMFELGKESLHEHKHIVALLKNDKEVITYFIGKDFYSNKLDKKNLFFFETFDEFSEAFREEKMENKTMLIKGSRGMALERTLELL